MTEKVCIAYALQTYGAKHSKTPWKKRPEVKPQVQKIERFVGSPGDKRIHWVFEYCRKAQSLDDLPNLKSILTGLSTRQGSAVLIDDAARIFKIVDRSNVKNILACLSDPKNKLFDLEAGKLVSEFSNYQQGHLIYTSKKPVEPILHAPSGRYNTEMRNAQRFSRAVRAQMAQRSARPVFDLKQKLEMDGTKISFSELARQANAQGLKTTRGSDWSGKAVQRALARYAEEDAAGPAA